MSRTVDSDDAPAMPPWPGAWTWATAALSVLLTIAFTAMRLAHVTDWPWIWVLCPLLIGGLVILLADLLTVAVKSPWDSPAGDDPNAGGGPATRNSNPRR